MRLEREATLTLIVLGLGSLPIVSYSTTLFNGRGDASNAVRSDYRRDEESELFMVFNYVLLLFIDYSTKLFHCHRFG